MEGMVPEIPGRVLPTWRRKRDITDTLDIKILEARGISEGWRHFGACGEIQNLLWIFYLLMMTIISGGQGITILVAGRQKRGHTPNVARLRGPTHLLYHV